MSPGKIVRIVNVVAVLAVALIPGIPMGGLILAIAGLVLGYYVASDNRVSLILIAVFLGAGGDGALDSIPAIGGYLTSILSSAGAALAAAAVTVFALVTYERLTED